jgi:(p)ppGpp synthase/HD superfamily hydrolase
MTPTSAISGRMVVGMRRAGRESVAACDRCVFGTGKHADFCEYSPRRAKELAIAEAFARRAHAGQIEQSTGDDYIHHVERVVSMVKSEAAKTVGWLHDVLEDTPNTASDLQQAGISSDIIRAVLILTHIPPRYQPIVTGTKAQAHEHSPYLRYIQQLKDSDNALAIAVKIADLFDHFRPGCPARLLPRYEKAWAILCPGAPLPDYA